MKDTRPQWLQDLDAVKTTVAEARWIIKRNKAVMRELDKALPYLIRVECPPGWERFNGTYSLERNGEFDGCPHCKGYMSHNACGKCNWHNTQYKNALGRPCVTALFGTVCLADLFQNKVLILTFGAAEWELAAIPTKATPQGIKRVAAKINEFCSNHVVWGEGVIERDKACK